MNAACAEVSDLNGRAAVAVAADVWDANAVRRYVETALDRFGSIEILFNNAGVEGRPVPLAECPEDLFDEVMAVNVRGVFLGLRHVLPVMLEAAAARS